MNFSPTALFFRIFFICYALTESIVHLYITQSNKAKMGQIESKHYNDNISLSLTCFLSSFYVP